MASTFRNLLLLQVRATCRGTGKPSRALPPAVCCPPAPYVTHWQHAAAVSTVSTPTCLPSGFCQPRNGAGWRTRRLVAVTQAQGWKGGTQFSWRLAADISQRNTAEHWVHLKHTHTRIGHAVLKQRLLLHKISQVSQTVFSLCTKSHLCDYNATFPRENHRVYTSSHGEATTICHGTVQKREKTLPWLSRCAQNGCQRRGERLLDPLPVGKQEHQSLPRTILFIDNHDYICQERVL